MGDVQRQVGQLHAAGQHHLGGVRVGVEVEFCHRGDIAAVEVRAAHHHHLFDAFGDVRALDQCQGQVGLWAEHGHGNAVGFGSAEGIDQVLHGIARGQGLFRFMHWNTGQAFFAMHFGSVDRRAHQRAPCPGVYRDVFAAGPLAGQAGVARGFVEAHVAGDGGDGADVEFVRRGHGQEQRYHIIGAGVGVDDQVAGCGLERGGGGCGHEGESL
ncbi:hypothetical protein D3C81_1264140 [compost metagenome]